MTIGEKILELTRQLYPTGRAFKFPFGKSADKLKRALMKTERTAYNDAVGILNSVLPDNDNFTADDASEWERRLGLVSNPLLPLATRKAAIERKLNHPGTIKARQNYRYVEAQLQAVGFDVYVYENRFATVSGDFETMTPLEVVGATVSGYQFGDSQFSDVQMGSGSSIAAGDILVDFQFNDGQFGQQMGKVYNNKIAYHVIKELDLDFNLSGDFKSTFFIGGDPIGTFATVPQSREEEFRDLVLKLKPVQTIAFTFINFA